MLAQCESQGWGAQIIDELTPHDGEHLIVKKDLEGIVTETLSGGLTGHGQQ
jgi:hypothetical protein